MIFCNNCYACLNISKSKPKRDVNEDTPQDLSQSDNIVDYDEIINKINDNEDIDTQTLESIDFVVLENLDEFKKLKNKNEIKKKIKILKEQKENLNLKGNEAYYVCYNCNFNKPIEQGALILVDTNEDDLATYEENENKHINKVNCPYFAITTNYYCPNKNCKTHQKGALKEAKIIRTSRKDYNTKLICMTCLQIINIS